MSDFIALVNRITNPFGLVVLGVFVFIWSDLWYVDLLGLLVTVVGLNPVFNKIGDLISNFLHNYKEESDIKARLKNLELEKDYDGMFSKFLKVLLSQDIRVFNRRTLIKLLGDNYKDTNEIIDYLFGDGDYLFQSASILHELVNRDIIEYNPHERLLYEYEVSVDYWNALRRLYPDIYQSKEITFDSVFEDTSSPAE